MLDPNAAAILKLIEEKGVPPMHAEPPPLARVSYRNRRFFAQSEPPTVSLIHDKRIQGPGGDLGIRIYRGTPGDDLRGALVFFHGGGWVIGDLESHDDVCRKLASQARCDVIAVDYRLAPEHPAPAAVDDCIAATKWIIANAKSLGIDPTRVAIGGDSAGGNLSAIVAMHSGEKPVFQLLVYPATDMRMGQQSHKDNAQGYLLTADSMKWFIGHYLQGDEKKKLDPRVSPILSSDADLKKSPPTLVITAEFDPLRDEGEEYAAKLASLGVPTSTVRFHGQIHAFFGMSELLDDAAAAISLSASYLRKYLGT